MRAKETVVTIPMTQQQISRYLSDYLYDESRTKTEQEDMKEYLVKFITDENVSICWGHDESMRDALRKNIKSSKGACGWAYSIGDLYYMKKLVTDKHYAQWWLNNIDKNDEDMKKIVADANDLELIRN